MLFTNDRQGWLGWGQRGHKASASGTNNTKMVPVTPSISANSFDHSENVVFEMLHTHKDTMK